MIKLEFKLLNNIHPSDITARHALSYIKSRGIIDEDILKYGFVQDFSLKDANR